MRPVATSTASARYSYSTPLRSVVMTSTSPSGPVATSEMLWLRIRLTSLACSCLNSSEISRSSPRSSTSDRLIWVTCDPSPAKICANSQATNPPPSTTSRRGSSSMRITSSEVWNLDRSSSGISTGSGRGLDPVAMTI